MEVLFKTVHGSRLYGLHHANSDHDFYTVVSKVKTVKAKYARQTIIDGVDSTVVDFGTWLHQCEIGVPQALEAMFSTQALEDRISAFRQGYVAGTGVWERYLRTIKSFALDEENIYKKKRHALRLACNFQDMRRWGRFNPTLVQDDVDAISESANMDPQQVYDLALGIAWYDGS